MNDIKKYFRDIRGKIIRKDEEAKIATLLERANEASKHPSTPGRLKEEIQDHGEKALQRALYNARESILPIGSVRWLDYELPVKLAKRGRRISVDLICELCGAKQEEGEHPLAVCELKYLSPHSNGNEPIVALLEGLIYFKCVQLEHQALDFEKIHHKGAKDFSWSSLAQSKNLFIIANTPYWNYWRGRDSMDICYKAIKDWEKHINISMFSLEMEPEYFINQLGNKPCYKPELRPIQKWKKL